MSTVEERVPAAVLIRGASVLLTGLPGEGARRVGDLRIAQGRIEAIGSLEPTPGERIVDASGCVVTPGLVNTHHHLFQSVLKAIVPGTDAALAEWLRLVPYRYGPHLDAEALDVAATIGLAELVLSGTTTVADHHYIYRSDADFDVDDVLFAAAARFGVRFVLCRGGATKVRTFDADRTTPMPTETLDTMFARIEATAARHHDPGPEAMTRVAVAPTTPTFSVETGELAEGVEALDVDTALRWATAGGADVLGFDGLGTLEPGKPADVAVFALDAPRHLGCHDPGDALVLAGGTPTLRASFVAGRQIVVDGAVPGLDLDELRHRTAAVVDRLRRRVAAAHS